MLHENTVPGATRLAVSAWASEAQSHHGRRRRSPLALFTLALLSILSLPTRASEWSAQTHTLAVGDFNGDGQSDLLYIARDPGQASGIALSDGTAPNIDLQSWPGNFLGIPWSNGNYVPVVGDFNGDRRDDLLLQATASGGWSFLLYANAEGKFDAIYQSIPASCQGLNWPTTDSRIIVGRFAQNASGEAATTYPRKQFFLQTTRRGGTSAIVRPTILSNAAFPQVDCGAAAYQSLVDGTAGFQWSVSQALVYAGNFNGDSYDDIFVQAKPGFAVIDYEVPFPVPTYRPESFGIVLSNTAGGLQSTSWQHWSRMQGGIDWSAATTNAIVADFSGDGRADILLQSRKSGGANYWFAANSTAQITPATASGTLANVGTGDAYTLLAANFSGRTTSSGGITKPIFGLYRQALSAGGGVNGYTADITGGFSSHDYSSVQRADSGLTNKVTPGTAVGYAPGGFAVDPTGAATYHIKIAVPPGVASLAPDLSLAYSSRNPNSLLGVGFALDGFSAINRCPSTYAVDGYTDGVDFDGNDAFCLDGQRLIAVSGTNGAVGAEYRTELETFQKVVSAGGSAGDPGTFTVWDKGGLIREYGITDANTATGDDSKFQARKSNQTAGQTVIWAIKRVRDRFGNFIEYNYEQELTGLNYWPTEITYGSKYDGTHTVVGRVTLSYAMRGDSTSGFMAGGFSTAMNRRLSKISVYGRADPTNSSGANDIVRNYFLNYQLSSTTSLSQLISVTLCDGGSGTGQRCLMDTKFQWQNGYRGFTNQYTNTGIKLKWMQYLKFGDLNGDGRTDFIANKYDNSVWHARLSSMANGETGFQYSRNDATSALAMDYDGDGLTDIVQRSNNDTSGGNYQIIYGSRDSTGGYEGWGSISTTSVPAHGLSQSSEATVVGDFNGDGRQDIAYMANSTTADVASAASFVAVQLNSASGFGSIVMGYPQGDARALTSYDFKSITGRVEKGAVLRVINFDGDGRDDLLMLDKDCITTETVPDRPHTHDCRSAAVVLSMNETGGTLNQVWPISGSTNQGDTWTKLKVLDSNGDGLTDILYFDGSAWRLLIGTGDPGSTWNTSAGWAAGSLTATVCREDWADFAGGARSAGRTCGPESIALDEATFDKTVVFDYDRDGRSDVLFPLSGKWYVLPSNGVGFRSEAWNTDRAAIQPDKVVVIDDRADGISDLLFPLGTGGDDQYAIYYGRGPISGLIEKITDGLGAETTVQYAPLTALDPGTNQPLVYKGHAKFIDDSVPAFPYNHLGAAVPVVYQFATDNGLGPNNGAHQVAHTSYEYRGLKVHRQGRGLLGFLEVRSWNDNSEIETLNRMAQQFPYTGIVLTSQQRFRNSSTYSTALSRTPRPTDLLLRYATSCDTNSQCADVNPVATGYNANASDYGLVSYSTNVVEARPISGANGKLTYFNYVRKMSTDAYPVSGGTPGSGAYKHTLTEYVSNLGSTADSEVANHIWGYDTSGNPMNIRVTTTNGSGGDVHITETSNSYSDDPSSWCLGRLGSSTVRSVKPGTNSAENIYGATDLTRTSSFTYQPGLQCVLLTETTEPGSSVELTKTYSYDTFGNRYKETLTGYGVTSADVRASGSFLSDGTSSSYLGTQGQFPTETRNAAGHREQTTWDGRFGLPASSTSPNGLVSTSSYDNFGVKIRETPMAALSGIYTDQHVYWCSGTGVCADGRSVYAVQTSSTDGSQTVSEFDRLARPVMARKLGFDGAWLYSEKHYDPMGRMYLASNPYTSGQSKCWTFMRFDALNRPTTQWESYASDECTSSAIPFNTTSLPGTGRTTDITYDVVGAAGIGTVTISNSGDTSGYATRRATYKFANVLGRTRFARDELTTGGCPSGGGALAANTSGCLQTEFDYDAQGNLTFTKQVGTLGSGSTAVSNKTLLTLAQFNRRGYKTLMSDPDMGQWSYGYDAFGQLISQTDAKGQITALRYDKLGRLMNRQEKVAGGAIETETTWTYDTATMGIGKLASVTASNGYSEDYTYDPYGRTARVKRQIDGAYYYLDQSYDGQGRIETTRYPGSVNGDTSAAPEGDANRLMVRNVYNGYGYLASVQNGVSGLVYWQANTVNEQDHVTQETLGNGAVTRRAYDPATGYLLALKTGTSSSDSSIQNMEFGFDQAANVRVRRDYNGVNGAAGAWEKFSYDGIYRLTRTQRWASAAASEGAATDPQGGDESYAYDDFGNLTSKGGNYTSYNYKGDSGSTRSGCGVTTLLPHAVYQLSAAGTTRQYCYDLNGNVVSASNSRYDAATWWVSNLARRISKGTTYTEFSYGPDRARFKQSLYRSSTSNETTTYVGGLYEKLRTVEGSTTTIEHTHYISAGDSVIAIFKRANVNGTAQADVTKYPHRDHLGSVVALTDATLGGSGTAINRFAYDSWGKRRADSTWAPSSPGSWPTLSSTFTKRGYTGHENVDGFGFVHMNGRIQDPEIGRFLSADPTMQSPGSTQGFNRYAYVGDNPLTYSDPSGFFKWKDFAKIVVITAIAVATGGTAGWLAYTAGLEAEAAGVVGAFVAGAVSGYLSSGTLKGAGIGGVVAVITAGVNIPISSYTSGFANALSSAALGIYVGARTGDVGRAISGFVTSFAAQQLGTAIAQSAGFTGPDGIEPNWTGEDQYASEAAQKSYLDETGGLLNAIGIKYAPTDGFGATLTLTPDGEYILAFRGTTFSSFADWRANLLQGMGFHTSQYDQAVRLAKAVYGKLDGNVVFAGHSLGGGLASAAARATGGRAITFNSAGLGGVYRRGSDGGIRAHYLRTDVLSVIQDWTPLPNAAGVRIPHNASWIRDPVTSHLQANFN